MAWRKPALGTGSPVSWVGTRLELGLFQGPWGSVSCVTTAEARRGLVFDAHHRPVGFPVTQSLAQMTPEVVLPCSLTLLSARPITFILDWMGFYWLMCTLCFLSLSQILSIVVYRMFVLVFGPYPAMFRAYIFFYVK